MATITLDGKDVLEARIVFPKRGVWTARLVLSEASGEPAAKSALKGHGLDLSCALRPSKVFGGKRTVLAVGGVGGYEAIAKPTPYRSGPVRTILGDLGRELGAKLSPDIEESVLRKRLDFFFRPPFASIGQCLDQLADALESGADWCLEDDGALWLGVCTYDPQEVEHRMLDDNFADHRSWIAPDAFTLRPGYSFLGRNIERVRHFASDSELRTEVIYGA